MKHKILGAALVLFGACAAHAQAGTDLGAFIGRWQINPAMTRMGRNGPNGDNILRSNTFTFLFTPEAQGLRMDVYVKYPLGAPTRTSNVIPDGKSYVCPGPSPCLTKGGAPSEQTYRFFEPDDHNLARIFYVKGAVYDVSTMGISTDGKTLTLISWAPQTPQYQNIQVFDKEP